MEEEEFNALPEQKVTFYDSSTLVISVPTQVSPTPSVSSEDYQEDDSVCEPNLRSLISRPLRV